MLNNNNNTQLGRFNFNNSTNFMISFQNGNEIAENFPHNNYSTLPIRIVYYYCLVESHLEQPYWNRNWIEDRTYVQFDRDRTRWIVEEARSITHSKDFSRIDRR